MKISQPWEACLFNDFIIILMMMMLMTTMMITIIIIIIISVVIVSFRGAEKLHVSLGEGSHT